MELVGRSILGYFTDRAAAERAKTALLRSGFETVQLDELHPAPGGDDDGPLAATSTAASGLAHELGESPTEPEPSWIITVVTPEDHVNRAVHILEECGGLV